MFKIEFGEHDGFLCELGIPELVIVYVTNQDGRRFAFPSKATTSIAQIYASLNAAADSLPWGVDLRPQAQTKLPPTVAPETPRQHPADQAAFSPSPAVGNRGSKLEREDIVLYTGPKTDDLETGMELRVQSVKFRENAVTKQPEPHTIDVVNDADPVKIRLTIFAKDATLIRKGVRLVQAKMNKQHLVKCACGEPVALELEQTNDTYVGTCETCRANHVLQRDQIGATEAVV